MEAEVAQKEYWARSLGYYLLREPYLQLMRSYMKEIAVKYDVPLRAVMDVRRTYVRRNPLVLQKKLTRKVRKYA